MVTPEILRECSFFTGLSDGQLANLAAIANEVSFEVGDLIFSEGDPAQALYLLLDGWVDIVIETYDQGKRCQLVTTLSLGDIFGWSAVVEPCVYTTSALCASPVRVVGFKEDDLRVLFEMDQRLCYTMIIRICQVIASRLRATRLQMATMFVMD